MTDTEESSTAESSTDQNPDEHGRVELSAVLLSDEFVASDTPASPLVAEYALRLGDDALVLAQRLGDWITRAPERPRRTPSQSPAAPQPIGVIAPRPVTTTRRAAA